MNTLNYSGRFCRLTELNTGNEGELSKLIQDHEDEYLTLIFPEKIDFQPNMFSEQVKLWFNNGRNYQFLVYNRDQIVGTIFLYSHNSGLKSIKLSCFFIQEVRSTLCIPESLGAVILFILDYIEINSLEFSVFNVNKRMLDIVKKIGAVSVLKKQHTDRQDYTICFDELLRLKNKMLRLIGF